MVRVVRLERTVSWSQTRRDTNFAIPGYSLFCHYTTTERKIKDFYVCGHSCGQSCFCAAFSSWGKTSKRPCRKALRRFASPYPGYNHGTPKAGALPTAQHPVMKLGDPAGRILPNYRLPQNHAHSIIAGKAWEIKAFLRVSSQIPFPAECRPAQ